MKLVSVYPPYLSLAPVLNSRYKANLEADIPAYSCYSADLPHTEKLI
jgi:hypothetical protein